MCRWWQDNFEGFLHDVGEKPSEDHTLGRLSNDGHYSCGHCPECLEKGWPLNCRWMTRTEHNRSRRPSSRSGKLNPEKVSEIRQRLKQGIKPRFVAKEFGVGVSLIGKIGRHEIWR